MKLAEIATPNNAQYETLAEHHGRILILGFGSVGQPILPLILRHVKCDPAKITVLELGEYHKLFHERFASTGVKYVAERITEKNLSSTLSKYLGPGDFLVNVSLNIDGIEIVRWCLENDVKYIDTSIERWEDQQDEEIPDMEKRTLYYAHSQIRKMAAEFGPSAATCIVTHGANPGLVSHFTKAALLDIVEAMKLNVATPKTREEWAQLMKQVGVKVIHIAERDTQVLNKPKVMGEFVNTWSCEGMWAEGRAPAELGFGTHEPKLPWNGVEHKEGPRNAIFLTQPGVSKMIKSWVPLGGTYEGFLIQHSEAVTISEYFTTQDGSFRPTVHYTYQPCNDAIASAHEMKGNQLKMQAIKRIAKDEIISGRDELGVLLMGGPWKSWWYGSQLDIHEARKLVPNESATSLQVAASILGAMVWAIKNPTEGYVEPEALPFEEILKVSFKYLGPMASVQSDWTPIVGNQSIYPRKLDLSEPWAFENFQVI